MKAKFDAVAAGRDRDAVAALLLRRPSWLLRLVAADAFLTAESLRSEGLNGWWGAASVSGSSHWAADVAAMGSPARLDQHRPAVEARFAAGVAAATADAAVAAVARDEELVQLRQKAVAARRWTAALAAAPSRGALSDASHRAYDAADSRRSCDAARDRIFAAARYWDPSGTTFTAESADGFRAAGSISGRWLVRPSAELEAARADSVAAAAVSCSADAEVRRLSAMVRAEAAASAVEVTLTSDDAEALMEAAQ